MEKKKNSQMVIIIILSIAILTMSVGFAAYSTSFIIGVNVNIPSARWDVSFDTNSYNEADDSINLSKEDWAAYGTTMVYNVQLNSPGDKYEFTINVVNNGNFNAKLKDVVITSLSPDIGKYLTYDVTYNGLSKEAAIGSKLNRENGIGNVGISVKYIVPDDVNDLPKSDINVRLLCTLEFVQDE